MFTSTLKPQTIYDIQPLGTVQTSDQQNDVNKKNMIQQVKVKLRRVAKRNL